VTPQELAARVERGEVTVIDVRGESETNEGRVPGSLLVPLGHLLERVSVVPRSLPVVLVCQSGSRSAIGASLLAALGFPSVANMPGGVREWMRAGFPLERDSSVLSPS
jgi:hydroxyacylglutathione hydrolase